MSLCTKMKKRKKILFTVFKTATLTFVREFIQKDEFQ